MLGHSYLFVGEDEVESLSDEKAVSEMLQLSILPQIADILTSMNKIDSGIVNEINSKLRPLEDLGASHYVLKEPIDNKNSLDIAVTVVKIVDSLNYPDPKKLFQDDKNIYRYTMERNGEHRPKSIPKWSYIQYIGPGKEVQILAGSAMIRPSEGFSEQYPTDKDFREDLIKENTVSIMENDYAIFNQNQDATSASSAGRIVFGTRSFQGTLFKNRSGETFPTTFEE